MSTLDRALGGAGVPVARTPHRTGKEPGAAPLAVLLTGTFLIVLDFFIVNVALPSIQQDLNVDATALEWLVAGYGLAFGALLLPASRWGDRYGRRRVFSIGVALFVLASAACGLAPGTPTLLLARLLQGAAAAAIGPTVLALIGDVYAGAARVRALGTYATVMGVAAASGQLIGGLLISADLFGLGWRTIFLVNVPVGLAALALAPRLLPDTRVDAPPVDVPEAVLAVAALTAVLLPLTEGREQGWPAWTWCSLAGAVVLGALTLRRGRALRQRGRRPLLDGAPLRHRPVAAGLVGQLALFTGMASYFLVLALYLQQGRGLTALGAGLVFTVLAVSYMAGTSVAPRLAPWGARTVVTASAVVFGLGHLAVLLAVAHIGVSGSLGWLVPGLAVSGLGMGVALASLVGAVMGSVEPRSAGTVSGTSSTLQQLGNALGVALVGIVYFGLLGHGVAEAFEGSLLYLVGTTVAVALAGLALPGRSRPQPAVAWSAAPRSAASGPSSWGPDAAAPFTQKPAARPVTSVNHAPCGVMADVAHQGMLDPRSERRRRVGVDVLGRLDGVEAGVHLPQIDLAGEGLTSARLLGVVQQARACGFAAVSANDHFRFARPWLDGLVALSLVAPYTGGLDLVTSVALPSLRGPLPLASALLALARLSDGRVVAGVGAGSSRADYELAGIPFEDRWDRFDRSVEALRSLLHEGSSPAGEGVGAAPDADIPVWVASWGSEAGLRRVARLGDGWMASAYNTDPDRFAAGVGSIADERARLGRRPAEVPSTLATMWTWVTESGPDADRVLVDVLAPMIGRSPEHLRGRVCVGSAKQCAELLSRYAAAGCRRVHFWPIGEEERQLELLAERVLPYVGQ